MQSWLALSLAVHFPGFACEMGAGSDHLSSSGFPYDRVDRSQEILREMMFRSTLDTISLEELSLPLLISISGRI